MPGITRRLLDPRFARLPALSVGVALCACDAGSDGTENGAGLPRATGTVAPLDWDGLQDGNIGATCGSADLDGRVEQILSRMTLAQKVFEMHGRQLAPIDGLYVAGGDDTLGVPAFRMTDGPRGMRTGPSSGTTGTATAFPVGMARGATWDPELERRVGLAIGEEVREKGGNVLLAPVVNLLRHPGWGRAQETYSEDPGHMGAMAVGFIGGVQNHVLASVKHFALNSIENTRFDVSANVDERTLREMYLPHFRRAVVEAHVGSVMSSYNRVNGTYAAENPHLLKEILKGEWAFPGFVESDWILGTRSTIPSATAGLDIEMPMPSYYGDPLVTAVESGQLDASVIDGAVRRILRQKLCFGLDAPGAPPSGTVESAEHVSLAREVAEKAIVLLENEGAALPLDKTSKGSIAVVGDLSDEANLGDHGSSSVTPSYAVGPLDGIRDAKPAGEVVSIPTNEPTAEDLEKIAAADVAVVVVGLTYLDEGEFIPVQQETGGLARGGDRADLDLPEVQQKLIADVAARAKKTVVVLEAGSAVTVRSWVDSVDALVMAWYPGMEGGHALASILFGDVNPSGKLPVTFPTTMDQLPPWDIVSTEIDYGYFHGYRLLDRNRDAPEYPFGFGKSYTEFALDRLSLDSEEAKVGDVVTLSVDVGNVGDRAGDEVVQAYVACPRSSVERPIRDLRAFRRVSLEAGEVKTLRLELRVNDLAYYDAEASAWTVEPLEYVVSVGTSSRDLPLQATFRVRK